LHYFLYQKANSWRLQTAKFVMAQVGRRTSLRAKPAPVAKLFFFRKRKLLRVGLALHYFLYQKGKMLVVANRKICNGTGWAGVWPYTPHLRQFVPRDIMPGCDLCKLFTELCNTGQVSANTFGLGFCWLQTAASKAKCRAILKT
jgi:hypothetical protein